MMKRKFVSGFQLWACAYAVLTVVSSLAQLFHGVKTDTNLNALARALVCLVPILTYYLFGFGTQRSRKKGALMLLLHYAISMACALLLIYLAGLIQQNASVAYVDIFITFTVAYALIASVIAINNRRSRKGAQAPASREASRR